MRALRDSRRFNFSTIFRLIGLLLLIESGFMLLPAAIALIFGEHDVMLFAAISAATAACGMMLRLTIRRRNAELGHLDGCLLTVLAWLTFSLFGMLPFMFCENPLPPGQAFFETVSGFTTTGATVIPDIGLYSRSVVFWRSLIQWVGGMGILLFTLAVVPSLNSAGGVSLFNAESTGISSGKLKAKISGTAKILWCIYGLLTLLCALLLSFGPTGIFDGICLAMTCMSTGGYSPSPGGVAAYGSYYTDLVLTLFMFLGGMSFPLMFAATQGAVRNIWRNDVFRVYCLLIAANTLASILLMIVHGAADNAADVAVFPLFHVVSAMTSTGYTAGDFTSWGAAEIMLTMAMMYIGACAGSTTGGAKIDRLIYMSKAFRSRVGREIHPRILRPVKVNNEFLNTAQADSIVAFMFIYTLLTVGGAMLLTAYDFPVADALFASVSCTANNGLGMGATSVSFATLPSAGLWVMSLLMLAGRLEIFTLIILLAPSFWRK